MENYDPNEWHKALAVVGNRLGLHARPAMEVVTQASQYPGKVELRYNGKVTDGKSIMGIMMNAAMHMTEVQVYVQKGEGHEECASALVRLIEKGEDI